jgi:N-sulfoglucosamine sulfohydrolase
MPLALLKSLCLLLIGASQLAGQGPNFLIAISDDQSYPYASAYGCGGISTPAFDRVAKAGVLFTQAFTPAPGCSPMRAAFLTGRHIWQIEHAGTHGSSFPKKYETFQKRLEDHGYFVGFTGKGWAPGNWKTSGRTRNPAGPAFQQRKMPSPPGISRNDYAANFSNFLKQRPDDKPFSFWFGASEPHRSFKKGIGLENGMKLADAVVPAFLPDTKEIRSDILDYCYEIQWFDQHLARMLDLLEKSGELDNTVVIVTSDNGMAFPRAKANVFEYGIHMPLAIAWPDQIPGSRTVTDLVNLLDVSATIYECAAVQPPQTYPIAGQGLLALLKSKKQGRIEPQREAVFSGRERHSSSRFNTLGYPQRCIRTNQYLLIQNFRPERWPAGTPRKLNRNGQPGREHGGYHDIDACPSLSFLIKNHADPKLGKFLELATAKRPALELYDIQADPSCLHNLAAAASHHDKCSQLQQQLTAHLKATADPRVNTADGGDIFETYPRYSNLRWFATPAWAKQQNDRVPQQPWLEKKRPKEFR